VSRFLSFLKTTTGMVTTVATLLVAVAGLIAAVKQLTGSQSSAEPVVATTVVSGDTPAERELRSHIPAELYGDKHECGPKPLLCFEQSSGEADIVWVDEPASIMGFAYRDDGHLDALYESWRKIAE
jgi:hypothetical protein